MKSPDDDRQECGGSEGCHPRSREDVHAVRRRVVREGGHLPVSPGGATVEFDPRQLVGVVPFIVIADEQLAITWASQAVLRRVQGAVGMSAAEVQGNRVGSAEDFARTYGATVALKGAATVIANPDEVFINSTGNPGMASGGMGDVLAGIIGAYLAHGMNPLDAAKSGVFIHGAAGDLALWPQVIFGRVRLVAGIGILVTLRFFIIRAGIAGMDAGVGVLIAEFIAVAEQAVVKAGIT